MAAAPITRIQTPPIPADSGTDVTVQADSGEKFAQVAFPWTAIIFTQDTVPVFGENAERVSVYARVGDVFTIERGDVPVTIEEGMTFALVSEMDMYDIGDTVTMRHDFGGDLHPYTLTVREPTGGTVVVTNGDITQGDGSALKSMAFDQPGRYVYRFDGNGAHSPYTDFFVRFPTTP